jgi:hypothetical protein
LKRIKDENSLSALPIVFSSVIAILVFFPYFTVNNVLSANQIDWGSFGSYIGGLLGPLISIIGFYYIVKSFRRNSDERLFDNTKEIIRKTEDEIDLILEKQIYINREDDQNIRSLTIYDFMRYKKEIDVSAIYYYDDFKSQTQLYKELHDIRTYLYFIMSELKKIENIRARECEVLELFYRKKYLPIIKYLFDKEIYALAQLMMTWDKSDSIIQNEYFEMKEFYFKKSMDDFMPRPPGVRHEK